MTTWSQPTRSASSWTDSTLDATTFSNQTKSLDGFILLENGFYMLKEDGYHFILEQAVDAGWANQSES